jgi:hypothetical protein
VIVFHGRHVEFGGSASVPIQSSVAWRFHQPLSPNGAHANIQNFQKAEVDGPLIYVPFRKYCGSTKRFARPFPCPWQICRGSWFPNSICSFTLPRLDNTPTPSGGQCNQSQGSAAACPDVESSIIYFFNNCQSSCGNPRLSIWWLWYPPAFPNSSCRPRLNLLKYQEVKAVVKWAIDVLALLSDRNFQEELLRAPKLLKCPHTAAQFSSQKHPRIAFLVLPMGEIRHFQACQYSNPVVAGLTFQSGIAPSRQRRFKSARLTGE